ncbi:MAG: YciI family protein [Actinomycetota bacterium]|nr:YciI family protein [Actinomycetota bacterium]
MQYTLLIYSDETAAADAPPEMQKQVMDEYMAFQGWLVERGIKRAGEALHDTGQATTVRVRDGGAMTTDGPFAETKEQLGGVYLIECDNLDDALDAARRCPGSTYGSVEVRPVIDFSQMMENAP